MGFQVACRNAPASAVKIVVSYRGDRVATLVGEVYWRKLTDLGTSRGTERDFMLPRHSVAAAAWAGGRKAPAAVYHAENRGLRGQ